MPEETIQESLELCQQICSTVSSTIQQYIDKQPSYKFFEAARVFDPRMVTGTEPASHQGRQSRGLGVATPRFWAGVPGGRRRVVGGRGLVSENTIYRILDRKHVRKLFL